MRKAMPLIALFIVALLSVSAHTERVFEAAEGSMAPLFTLTQEGDTANNSVSLTDLKGEVVLLSFWSSEEPTSRIAAKHYDSLARQYKGQLSLLSVNVDRSERLFREIVRRDRLNEAVQFHLDGNSGGTILDDYNVLAQRYRTAGGMNSYLIDRTGRIIAINPSTATIISAIGR